jgi:transposase-like protein
MAAITAELVDTGEKRDARGRRVTPQDRRTECVEAYRQSGLTMAAFARREKLNYATFAGWVAKAGEPVRPKNPVRFAEVRLPLPAPASPGTSDRLEVRLADGTVVCGGNVAEVAALVRALRG